MKKIILSLITLIGLTFTTHAQTAGTSGVYMTYDDYLAGKLSFAVDCSDSKNAIRVNDFVGSHHITVLDKGITTKIPKSKIFGISLCGISNLIRFQNSEDYYLVDKGEVWIYYTTEYYTVNKTINSRKYYFFSVGGNSEVLPLTKENLNKAFPRNTKFHDLLDQEFRDTDELGVYDSFVKKYKVNHLLEISK